LTPVDRSAIAVTDVADRVLVEHELKARVHPRIMSGHPIGRSEPQIRSAHAQRSQDGFAALCVKKLIPIQLR
jgi:hypothetical protein